VRLRIFILPSLLNCYVSLYYTNHLLLYYFILIYFRCARIALGYGLDDRGFNSRQRVGIFLFTTAFRPALEPIQPLIQWVPVPFSLGVKRPLHEADYSFPFSVQVKNAWSCTSTSAITPSWRGAQLTSAGRVLPLLYLIYFQSCVCLYLSVTYVVLHVCVRLKNAFVGGILEVMKYSDTPFIDVVVVHT
jgi:hypothetical protein